MFFRKAIAFIKRDFWENTSYRLSFFFDLGGILSSVLIFFFVARLFEGGSTLSQLEQHGGYFPFVLIGLAFSGYLTTAMSSFSGSLRTEQATGTLEGILVTPTSLPTIIVSGALWNFLYTTLRIFVYLFAGAVFFGVNLGKINLLSSLIVLILTIISFSSLGIISASFIIVLKRGDPINWFFSSISRFLGGVYFPIAILPLWVQKVSHLLPITYSLKAMRLAVLQGASPVVLVKEIIPLSIFCIVLLPLSILCFKIAIRKVRRDGSLVHY